MGFRAYCKGAIWDFLLNVVVTFALIGTAFNAFYISPDLHYSPWSYLISVVLLLALFLIAYNKKILKWGIIGYLLLIIAIAGISISLSSDGFFLDDREGNYLIFSLITMLVPTASFLLSRKLLGTVTLFIIGVFVCAWTQFFYERYELMLTLGFVFASIALVIYKNFQLSTHMATSVRKVNFSAGAAVAAVSVGVSLAIGAGLWFGAISQLNPKALEIKLITENRALETLQVKGTSNVYQTPNLDMTSSKLSEDERTTDDLKVDPKGRAMPARFKATSTMQQNSSGSFMGIDVESLQKAFDFQTSPNTAIGLLVLFLLVPLGIIAYFIGRRIARKRKLSKISTLRPEAQVVLLYEFFIKALGHVGISLPKGATVYEFANNNAGSMRQYSEVSGIKFIELTEVFAAVSYGGHSASQADTHSFKEFYRSFYKASRKHLGSIKYFFKSFRL